MTALAGPITRFLALVGLRQQDDRVLEVIELVGTTFEREEFTDPDAVYWSFLERGVTVLFQDDELASIMFDIMPEQPGGGVWDEPLITGLPLAPDEAEVREFFGEPERTGRAPNGPWLRYRLDKGYLHFEYAKESLARISLLSTAP